MDNEFVTLSDTAPQPTINIDTGVAPPQPPSEDVARSRAAKAHMGLGEITNLSYDDIYKNIAEGKESALRENAALNITAGAMEVRQKALIDLAATKKTTLTLDDITKLTPPQVKPEGVIEQTYARSYVNTLKQAAARMEDTILTDAQIDNPEAVGAYMNKATDLLSNREFAITMGQNIKADLDKIPKYEFKDFMGITHKSPTDLDFKRLLSLGFYEGYVLRKNIDTESTDFIGNILDKKATELLRLPAEQFQAEMSRITTALRGYDDDLAYKWVQAVIGMGENDKFLDSALEVANVATLGLARPRGNLTTTRPPIEGGPLSPGPDGVYRPSGGGPTPPGAPPASPRNNVPQIESDDLGRGAMSVQEILRQSPVPPQVQKAVKDMVQSAANPEISKATIAEGAGDIKEAAVQKAIVSTTQPDPQRDATNTLFSAHRMQTWGVYTEPGNLSREAHTRFLDAAEGYENRAVNLLTDSVRVLRTPALAERGYRDILDNIGSYFPGRDNTILDANVRWEPFSATNVIDFKLGNYNSEPFSSRQLAENHARINGYPIQTEGTDVRYVYLPASAVIKNEYEDRFMTSKGSSYIVHEDGTTTRNKAARPEHPGDSGPQPRSTKTFYITPEEYTSYKNSKTRGFDGYAIYTDKKNQVSIQPKDEPEVGLIPVEIWHKKGKASVHFGNEIVKAGAVTHKVPRDDFELREDEDGTVRFIDGQGNEVLTSPKPQPGMIPYDTKTKKFLPELTEQTARIEQQGLGFHIVFSVPINETDDRLRDLLITSDKTKSISNKDTRGITSVGNSLIGLVRNPYDTLSVYENSNRAKTVFGQSKFLEFLKEEIKPVEQLYRNDYITHKPITYMQGKLTPAEDFTRALVFAQTAPDPVTKLPGYYMQTPLEIQSHWLANYKRPASELEQQAYLAVGRLSHFDHVLRSILEYRNKQRLGVMQMQFTVNKEEGPQESPWFDAQLLNRVPAVGEDVLLIVHSDGREQYWHSLNPDNQKLFRERVENGQYQGGQLYNPEARPITRVDDEGNILRIRWIFSNGMKMKPITYDQVGYRGGGHWDYDYDNSVKQAIVRRQKVNGKWQDIYEGDATFGFVTNRAQGEEFATHMNEIARLLHARDRKGAKAYATKHMDIEWKKLSAAFRSSKDPKTGAVKPARFSTDPRLAFRVVPKGSSINQLDQLLAQKFEKRNAKTGVITSTFIDGTKHGSLARNFQVAFTQPRESYDLHEFANTGTNDRPFYEFRPAKLTDPITTLTRAMERAVSSIYMDDMKMTAAEHWLEENKDLFEDDIKLVRSSPFWYLKYGRLKRNVHNASRIINAETNRYKIKDFIGEPSKIDLAMHGVRQAMSDALYAAEKSKFVVVPEKLANKVSPKLGQVIKAPLLAPEWLLDRVSAPIDALRGFTFHTTLGLLNWTQIVAQSFAYTTIYGLAGPSTAAAGSMGALLHQWSRINKRPNIIAAMDEKATNFGWKPGEFTEAMHFMDRSGFGVMGNSISLDNGLAKNNFFIGDGSRFLRSSQIFFDLANQNVRFGAYYTAFYEFRKKYPFKKITQLEEGDILYRANFLNTLMSRDANTILNKGLVGVPMMFFDYTKKSFDVFTSTHIGETKLERAKVRARMFAINALLFGAVGATGLTSIPGGDMIRKKMIERGYTPGANTVETLFMEGPMAMLGAYITGRGDMQKGTFYDWSNRFGPNGIQLFRDLLESDASFWKILVGAVGSKVGDTLSRLSPFVNVWYSQMESDPSKNTFKLTHDDWIRPLDVINSWSMGKRLLYAEAYGKWYDRNGRPVSDVGKVDALFRSLSGLRDVVEDDIYLRNKIDKEKKKAWDEALNEYERYARLADDAASAGNKQQADQYNKNADFVLRSVNVPLEYYGKAIQRRAQMNRNTLDKNLDRYYLQLLPADKRQIYIDAYKQLQKRNP